MPPPSCSWAPRTRRKAELRPRLLDRFGLCVPVVASADPVHRRAEVMRARLDHDRSPAASARPRAAAEREAHQPHRRRRAELDKVELPDAEPLRITCGLRQAGRRRHAGGPDHLPGRAGPRAWQAREAITGADVRILIAARLARCCTGSGARPVRR